MQSTPAGGVALCWMHLLDKSDDNKVTAMEALSNLLESGRQKGGSM